MVESQAQARLVPTRTLQAHLAVEVLPTVTLARRIALDPEEDEAPFSRVECRS